MSGTIKTVMIIGAGGVLGKPIIESLLANGTFTVSVLARETTATSPPSGVTMRKCNFDHDNLVEAFTGQDAVVCLLGSSAIALQSDIIRAAAQAGVKRFIPSEFGSDVSNPGAKELVPLFKKKADVIAYLEEVTGSYSSFSWTAITTGPFFDWGLHHRSLGFDLDSCTATIFDPGDFLFSTSTISTVTQAVTATLLKPDETANRRLFVASFTISQNEILAEIEKISGSKWEVKSTPSAGMASVGRAKLAKGDPTGSFLLMAAALCAEDMGNNFEENGRILDNYLLGLRKENLKDVVEQAITRGN